MHDTPPVGIAPNGTSPTKGKGKAKFKPLFDTDKKREAALHLAFELPMARTNTYTTRPNPDSGPDLSVAQLSLEWQRLLGVLNEALRFPSTPRERGECLAVQVESATQGTSATYIYEWDAAYLSRLHNAISAVMQAHGRGLEGWDTAKWAVYDAVRPLIDCLCVSERR